MNIYTIILLSSGCVEIVETFDDLYLAQERGIEIANDFFDGESFNDWDSVEEFVQTCENSTYEIVIIKNELIKKDIF